MFLDVCGDSGRHTNKISSHVTPKGSSGYFGGGKYRKPAESVGKLCQILSVVLDQEKSQTFVANQSIEIS